MRTHTRIATALLLATAAFTSLPAMADEGWTTRAAGAMGQYIAAQGNAALRQIRTELKEDLMRALKPVLPAPAPGERDQTENPQAPKA